MGWLHIHVHRHVHGDPGYTDRCDFPADHPERDGHRHRPDDLDPDSLSYRRNRRDTSDRLSDREARHALAVRRCGVGVYSGIYRLRGKPDVRRVDRVAHHSGLCRRHSHSGSIFGSVPAFPSTFARNCHDHCGCCRGFRANGRANRRRLDHGNLFLALAVSDQHCAGNIGSRRCCDDPARSGKQYAFSPVG